MNAKLKSLELVGFKTFAKKTKFEFSENITAVVGPNGSGKSNISDALRWVLGEQSFISLRGKKTEDMIFSGTDGRSRASMASATVVFDNSDGWLPIDFSEVSVTRKAYRDGQNQYLINNRRVRLIDVREMLAKSGLSERTYTVVSQGLVDKALTLKSEDRRRLFEEAAGIGLYRTRKEQSLRRLDKTKRNLERVQDILAELEPRIKSLSKQAKRAIQFDQIRDDLKNVLREWYGYHWHQGQRNIREARSSAKEFEQELASARNSYQKVSVQLISTRDNIIGYRNRLAAWHRELAKIHTMREETSKNLAVNDERRKTFLLQLSELSSEKINLQKNLDIEKEKFRNIQLSTQKLATESFDAKNRSLSAKESLQQLTNQLKYLENELLIAENNIQKLRNQRIEYEATISAIESANLTKIDNKKNSQFKISELEESLSKFEILFTDAENLLNRAKNLSETNQLEIAQLKKSIIENISHSHTLQSLLSKHSTNQARFNAELKVLLDAEKNYAGYASGAKLLLDGKNSGRLSTDTSVLSSHLVVPKEYEIAIGSVLGDYANAVIIKRDRDLSQSLEILETEKAKAAILPSKNLSPENILKVKDQKGVIGIGADLVETNPEYRPAVDLLLGQVVVVESRGIAKSIISQIPNQAVVVTLAGELFFGSGLILVDHKGGLGVLGKAREKDEIIDKVDEETRKINDIKEELENISQLEENLSVRLKSKENEFSILEQEEIRAFNDFNSLSLETDQWRNKVNLQRIQDNSIDTELELNLQKITEISKTTITVDSEIEKFEQNIRGVKVKIAQISLDESQRDVNFWDTEFAVISRALRDSEGIEKERKSALEITEELFNKVYFKDNKLKTNFDNLESETSSMKDSEGGIGERIKKLQEFIDPEEIKLSRDEVTQIELQEIEEKNRHELSVSERRNSNAQIRLAKEEESLSTLRHKIIDDFGLVEFEYEKDVSGPTPLPFGSMVERLPIVKELSPELDETLKRQRLQLRRIGAINPEAKKEFKEVKERHEFLTEQSLDLENAEIDLRNIIDELDGLMEKEFRNTFENVSREFKDIFKRLFIGGSAKLLMTEGDAFHDLGVDIEVKLPGKRVQRLALLSGGERSLTAAALIFALIKSSPTPFCIMDEVDAALDEANVGRFCEVLLDLGKETQFVVITHNRNTVQISDVIYGITMGRDSVSQSISLKLDEVDEKYSK